MEIFKSHSVTFSKKLTNKFLAGRWNFLIFVFIYSIIYFVCIQIVMINVEMNKAIDPRGKESFGPEVETLFMYLPAAISFFLICNSSSYTKYIIKSLILFSIAYALGWYAITAEQTYYNCFDLCGVQFFLVYPPIMIAALLIGSIIYFARKKKLIRMKY